MAAWSDTIPQVHDDDVKEKSWAAFLTHLTPWEWHRIFYEKQGLEMELHDSFMKGDIGLDEVLRCLFPEQEES